MAVVLEIMQLDALALEGGKWGTEYLHSTADLGQIAVGDHLRRLVADANLEASRAPINELDSALSLQRGNSHSDVLGDDIATVQQASSHVLSIARIALHHLVVRLEAGHGHLLDGIGLVGRLGSGDDWRVGYEREVDARIGHQVRLELVEINIEGTIKPEGGSDGRHN